MPNLCIRFLRFTIFSCHFVPDYCRTISHNGCSTHRTGIVGEWLQSCNGQTSAAGSGCVDDAVSQTAVDEIAGDDSITL